MTRGDTALGEIASRQHGLVTRADALTVLSRRQLECRVASARLQRVRPQVYRVAGAPETWEQTVLSACLAAGDGAFVSHRTAARIWGLAGFDTEDLVEVTTPSRRRRRLDGVVVHDTEVLGRRHATTRHGIPLASVARTLCDLTSCCPGCDVERALDEALRRRLTTLRSIRRVFLDLAGRGRRRSNVMRALLEARDTGFEPAGSPIAMRTLGWIVAAGLPRPVLQHRVRAGRRSFRLDLAYPELMIAIEHVGWDPLRTRQSLASDCARQNELEVREWLVLRFTASSTRDDVVGAVRTAIETRRRPCSR